MDYILQKATELGVSEIVPTVLNRSIIKLDDAKFQKKKVRWQKICKEASEQSDAQYDSCYTRSNDTVRSGFTGWS